MQPQTAATNKRPPAPVIFPSRRPIGRKSTRWRFLPAGLAFFAWLGLAGQAQAQTIPSEITVNARVNTGSVSGDADDPAIWIHPTDPAQSLVIGTDKIGDAVYVWDMNGQQRQRVSVSATPNNGDVRYGMPVGGVPVDIYVVGAENPSRLVIFKIDPNTRQLSDITASGATSTPQVKEPYGVCLYRRASDGAYFAFVNSNGGVNGVLNQYQLLDNGAGRVRAVFVRSFGGDVNGDHSEGMVADDELGYVYISEEDCCVHKFHADPAMGNQRLAVFAQGDGIDPDREGLGIYGCADGTGYLLLSSQGNKRVKVYRREGDPGNPHSHSLVTTIYTPQVGGTDGLDVTNLPAGPTFPFGFMAKHNSTPKNFALIAWEDIAQTYLTICPNTCAITADFSANMTQACAGLPVNFTDLTSGSATSWSWDFGDGQTSTSQNPTHIYAAPGVYTVTLTSSDGDCSDEETKTNFITVTGAPAAEFIASSTSGNAPFTVNFTDQSTGNPTSWAWDFGDGGTSTAQNPSHTYTAAGDYTVTLTATSSCDSDTETKTAYIHVDPCIPPAAEFIASSTSGNAPFTVNFTDQSTGNPTSWAWDFGDGGTSTAQNPSHTYTAAGDYTVTLTATSSCDSDTETKTAYIHVDPCIPPAAGFIASSTSGNAPFTVNFTDQSTGNPTSWAWDFGDGGTSTAQNPSHTYTAAGDYTVTLTATSSCDSDAEIKTAYIHVDPCIPPAAGFIASSTSGNAPFTVNFTDQSTGNPTSWAWDFGDGGTSTAQNPSHTYNAAGDYTVTLTATSSCDSDTETKTAYIHVDPCLPPAAAFIASSTSGNAPFTVNFTDQSTGNPTSWAWDFGDGGTSTAQNPAHTYNAAGDYTVTLTATSSCDSDVETKANYITVTNAPTGNLALNKPATASSTYSSYAPSRAVDGSTTSYWRSANVTKSTPNTWLAVDLGSAFSLTRAVIRWKENYYAQRYRFQISNSGGTSDGEWTTVHTNNAGVAGSQNVTFTSPFAARYFRVRMDQNNKANNQVFELECYAGAAKISAGETDFATTASPAELVLEQNYPNPFNPTTLISFRLPAESEISLTIYSTNGQLIKRLAGGWLAAGRHRFEWDATDENGRRVASGVYLYLLQAGEFAVQRKLLLMK